MPWRRSDGMCPSMRGEARREGRGMAAQVMAGLLGRAAVRVVGPMAPLQLPLRSEVMCRPGPGGRPRPECAAESPGAVGLVPWVAGPLVGVVAGAVGEPRCPMASGLLGLL